VVIHEPCGHNIYYDAAKVQLKLLRDESRTMAYIDRHIDWCYNRHESLNIKEVNMADLIFTFEVPKEKQEEFISFVKTGTKAYFESHGCLAYNIWQVPGENFFMKRMEFPDMATLEKVVSAVEQDPEAKALLEKWGSYCENVERKPYVKMT
jgi:hypothetical protein